MTFLRERARSGDAFASVRPHSPNASMGAFVVGEERYFGGNRFLRIESDASLGVLDLPPWSDCENTVWVLCNKTPRGIEVLPAPLRPTRHICCHDFNGLFVLEVRGGGRACSRLMEALALLDRDLPARHGLIASNLFRARYYREHGDEAASATCIAAARRQCRDEAEKRELARFLPRPGLTQVSVSTPDD
jgi:hypothetical protein